MFYVVFNGFLLIFSETNMALDDDIKEARKKLAQLTHEQVAAEEQAIKNWIESMKSATANLSKLLPSHDARDDEKYNPEKLLIDSANTQIKQAEDSLAARKKKAEVASSITTMPPKNKDDKTCTFSKESDGSYKIAGGDLKFIKEEMHKLAKAENYHIKEKDMGNGGTRCELYHDKEHKHPLKKDEIKKFMDKLYSEIEKPLKDKGYAIDNKMNEQNSDKTIQKKHADKKEEKPSTAPMPKPTPSGTGTR